MGSSGSTATPFGFVGSEGYQEDGDSGLMLLGHRYYDPTTGQFLTRDPEQDGRNWYAYCDNNPLSWVDADGLRYNDDPEKGPGERGKPRVNKPDKKNPGTSKKRIGPNRSKKYSTRKRAEDAARRYGDGKPIHHPNPPMNELPHFHPSDREGKKISGPHFEYDRPNSRPEKRTKVRINRYAAGAGLGMSLFFVWEGGKWILAAIAVPETFGGSLGVAAAIP